MDGGHVLQHKGFKAVLLGDSGVGKTALMTRWSTGTFTNNSPTIGANHIMRKINFRDDSVDMFVWDTAGQEQFQSLTPLYVRSASVAIITAAINNADSFDHIGQWLSLLEASSLPVPPAILAVNKDDLEPIITRDEIYERFSSKFTGIFFVSAKKNEMVNELFSDAATKGYDFFKTQVPVSQPKPESNKGCQC